VQRIDAIPKNAMGKVNKIGMLFSFFAFHVANCCEELLKVFEKKLGTNITSKKSA
jgi:hypothetical protein